MVRREIVARWLVFAAVAAGVLMWAWNIEQQAERQARAFCADARLQQPFAAVVERAQTTGDHRLRIVTDDRVLVAFKGIAAFSRHGCEVQGKDGQVVAARYLKVD